MGYGDSAVITRGGEWCRRGAPQKAGEAGAEPRTKPHSPETTAVIPGGVHQDLQDPARFQMVPRGFRLS